MMRSSIGLLLCCISINAASDSYTDRGKIERRIKPIGQVRIEKPMSQAPVKADTLVDTEKSNTQLTDDKGKAIYEQHCIICHRDGVAGAPKFQDKADWEPRLANRTIADLVASAIKGKNAMPPKGTCQECTDSDIKVAIEYMMPKT